MGTRHLICVMIGGKYKVAQYGNSDGYPSYHGEKILNFLKSYDKELFKKQVEELKFLSVKEAEAEDEMTMEGAKPYEHLNINTSSGILKYIHDGGTEKLIDSLSFAGDSLDCEWCYVIDFDLDTFEIYKGFNNEVITEGRFLSGDKTLMRGGGSFREPVKLYESYDLNNLPDNFDCINY